MYQIKKLEERLIGIGFKIEVSDSALQIVGFAEKNSQKFQESNLGDLEIDRVAHVLQIVIEFEDPTLEGQKYLFQGCSLKVYFETWELQEVAKIIKFNIAHIMNDHGIFEGMGFVFPKDHQEVLVP